MSAELVAIGVLGAGALLVGGGALALVRRARESRVGTLLRVETDGPLLLRSPRFRLAGRPDELRRAPDGAIVPVEYKHRPYPSRGAFYSHTVQLWAYCLLIEETTGRSPPFGVLRYQDREERVAWNAAARSALLDLRRRALAPYDGRAEPSVGKCSVCAWTDRCDASAVRGRSVEPSTPR